MIAINQLRLTILVLCLAALTSVVSSQQSLTTIFSINSGGANGGAVYFTLTAGVADITITDIDFNLLGAGGASGSVDIYTTPGTHAGNETNPALWTMVATCPIASSNPTNVPTNGVLSTPLTILAGTSVGVCYTDGSFGTAQGYTHGLAAPAQYTGCGLTLDAGSASNTAFTGAVFIPRIVNTTIYFTSAGSCASVESIGLGCIEEFTSVYEVTDLAQFAGANTMPGIDFTSTAGGYVATLAAGSIQAVGSLDPSAVPVAGVGDDVAVAVGTLGLVFGSNGWLATGAGNSTQWVPSPTLFLNQAASQFSCWSDFQPNSGSAITYEEFGTQALLTYDQLPAWGTTDLNTFQFAYDAATGDCSLYFGAMASSTNHTMMIGYSPAGPSNDPGSVSFATELANNGSLITSLADHTPLQLAADTRPVQLAGPSDWNVTTTNFESTALLHVGVVGVSNPSLPLSVVGFPASCTLYASADVLVGPDTVTGLSSHTWTVLTLPASASAFFGFEIYTQAVTLDATLAGASARASNGIKGTVGDA